jgi:hypothetical protein
MSEDPTEHGKLIIIVLIILSALVVSIAFNIYLLDPVEAKQDKSKKDLKIKKSEALKEIKYTKTRYSPKKVLMNSADIYVVGVLPTRNTKKWGYKRYNVHVKNKANGRYGVLGFEIGNYYGKAYTSPESLLYIKTKGWKYSDEDYSIVNGDDHGNRGHKLTIVKRSVYKTGDEKRYKKIFKIK